MQREAGVVGVLQSVLKLHLHRQAPAGAANHIRLLSVGKTAGVHHQARTFLRREDAYPDLDPVMSM